MNQAEGSGRKLSRTERLAESRERARLAMLGPKTTPTKKPAIRARSSPSLSSPKSITRKSSRRDQLAASRERAKLAMLSPPASATPTKIPSIRATTTRTPPIAKNLSSEYKLKQARSKAKARNDEVTTIEEQPPRVLVTEPEEDPSELVDEMARTKQILLESLSDESLDLDESEDAEEFHRQSSKKWMVGTTIIMVALASILAGMVYDTSDLDSVSRTTTVLQDIAAPEELRLPPCFQDSYPDPNVTVDVRNCQFDPIVGLVPCPPRGTCSAGMLTMCEDPSHFVPADFACVLKSESIAVLDAMEAQLITWTKCHLCALDGSPVAIDNKSGSTRFALSSLFEELRMPWDLVPLKSGTRQNLVVETQEDGLVVVGLSDDYVKQLNLPAACGPELVSLPLNHLWDWKTSALDVGIEFLSSSPQPCLIGIVVILALLKWRRYIQRKRKEDLVELGTVREMVLERVWRLHENFALRVRDDIAYELYPTSRKDRENFVTKVWPKVVRDIRKGKGVKAN